VKRKTKTNGRKRWASFIRPIN